MSMHAVPLDGGGGGNYSQTDNGAQDRTYFYNN